MKLSVIVATYNERENVERLVTALMESVTPAPEIVIVDDDSPDRTWEAVQDLQLSFPNLKLLRRVGERNRVIAVSDGVAQSTGDVIAWMDGDLSHPPRLLPQMLELLESCDLVLASRYRKGGGSEAPFARTLTSWLFNTYARLVLGSAVTDWTSGFPMMRRETYDLLKIVPLGKGRGEYFVNLLYQAVRAGLRIEEVPYVYRFRTAGDSKIAPNMLALLEDAFTYGTTVLRIRLNGGIT